MTEQVKIRNYDLSYDPMSDEEMLKIHRFYSNLFKKFLDEMNYPSDIGYYINSYALIDAIVRVDKRKAYFYCFHNMDINENKEVALYAYFFIEYINCKALNYGREYRLTTFESTSPTLPKFFAM